MADFATLKPRRHPLTQEQSELDRIRAYLQAQAAKKSIPELIESVREGVADLAEAVNNLDRERVNLLPPVEEAKGGTWTPLDCLQHSVGSNASVARDVLYVAHTGEFPTDENDPMPDHVDQLMELHERAIESVVAHVQDADPDAFLDVQWTHPMFGDLNWREWFLFLRIHSKDHARQLQGMTDSWSS